MGLERCQEDVVLYAGVTDYAILGQRLQNV